VGVTTDLFEGLADAQPLRETIAEGAVLLLGFTRTVEQDLLAALRDLQACLITPVAALPA
jgi:alkylated DNA repair protein (DNA oxidative demethylase)